MQNLNDIRKAFLDHVEENGHVIISSSTLVPENDPTTLFTGSGMQPMVPYLLGQVHPLGKRIADSQKCFRSQDIEEVGDNRHTTFFEMLGNWSLGDYFKTEQIYMMWDFLVNKIKLDPSRLYFSVYKGNNNLGISRDDEAISKWQEKFSSLGIDAKVGINPEEEGMKDGERIFCYPDKKNWWSRSGVPENMPVGEPGGPDTEMFFDFDAENKNHIHENSIYKNEICHVNCDCGRFVEIGNNVFMQFMRTEKGVQELRQKNVDFGGGLERMAAAVANDSDVFNLDVFIGAKEIIKNISKKEYGNDCVYAYRVILDHLRAATFLIADGVYPGNKDQMYFVRRLIRRAVRFARDLDVHTNFTVEVSKTFIDYYQDQYPELKNNQDKIIGELEKEESKFRKTLDLGMKEFETIYLNRLFEHGVIPEDVVFNLVTSFGFPFELIEEIAKERNLSIDKERFEKKMEEHKNLSRSASEGKFKGGLGGDSEMEVKYHTATHILHTALRQVLGDHVLQKGSNITTERLRFDFSHESKMTDEEKKKVEDIVNDIINKDMIVHREEVSYEKAREMGAIGVFDNKYGDTVSLYHVGDFSLEFCGGPHVGHTGLLGKFKIIKEEAVSQGVRRIKAVLE